MRILAVAAALLALLVAPPPAAVAEPPSTAGLVVWTTRAADGSESLRIANAAGTAERALTEAEPGERHLGAQFSPNGKWIAYEASKGGRSEVRLVRPDGTDDHRLAIGCKTPCVGTSGPTWASNRVLFVTRVKGPFTNGHAAESLLWTVHLNGSSTHRTSLATAAGKYEDSYGHVSRGGFFVTWTRVRVSDGKSTIMRVDSAGDDEHPRLPWQFGVEAHDVSMATSGPTRDLVIFESTGRGDPDATFVDIGVFPILCNFPKQCEKQIVWLTDNKDSGKRAANPQWSPDGLDYVFNLRARIKSQNAQIWTARYGTDERLQISTSKRFDYRPDWGP